jgi:hypothetical protein
MNFRRFSAADARRGNASPATAHPDRRRLLQLAACVPVASMMAGCAGGERGAAAPAALADQVTVLGIPNARFWPDQGDAMVREAEQALKRERDAAGRSANADWHPPPAYFLAISGGGDDGPFASGLLCGWSDAGTIPSFNLVTGVSTGAMIAPFAFLGHPYNDRLRAMYTTIKADDILEKRGLYGAVFGDSLADTTPLFHLISGYINEQMLAGIAREYNKGRLLLVGSTSLDQQRRSSGTSVRSLLAASLGRSNWSAR